MFAPIWIVMFFSLIALTYIFVLTIILSCYRHMQIENRSRSNNITAHITTTSLDVQTRWLNVAFYTVFYFSLLAFELLLVQKLDNDARYELINQLKNSVYNNRDYSQFFLQQDQFHGIIISSINNYLMFYFKL